MFSSSLQPVLLGDNGGRIVAPHGHTLACDSLLRFNHGEADIFLHGVAVDRRTDEAAGYAVAVNDLLLALRVRPGLVCKSGQGFHWQGRACKGQGGRA